MPASLPDDVRAAIAAGHKIEAIRLLRQHSGLGLAEAKAAVESAALHAAPASHVLGHGFELPPEAKSALARGSVLQAIRILGSSNGIGLKDAKAFIDAARGAPVRPEDYRASGLAPGEVPRSRFSAGTAVIVLIIVVAVLWLMRTRG